MSDKRFKRYVRVKSDVWLPKHLEPFRGLVGELGSHPFPDTYSVYFKGNSLCERDWGTWSPEFFVDQLEPIDTPSASSEEQSA